MIPNPEIATQDAIQHLKQIAASFGYDLLPALSPVIKMPAREQSIVQLANKKKWSKSDINQAIIFCEDHSIKIPGLTNFLKYNV